MPKMHDKEGDTEINQEHQYAPKLRPPKKNQMKGNFAICSFHFKILIFIGFR